MRGVIRLGLLAVATLVAVLAACGRGSFETPDIRILSFESARTTVRPGLYGVPVRVRLYNHGAEAKDVRVGLTFRDANGPRDDFEHREIAPLLDRIATYGTAEVLLEVDVLTTAIARDVVVEAVLFLGTSGGAEMPAQDPLFWRFTPVRDLVVDSPSDAVVASDGAFTLREAIGKANEEPGVDRILFDPVVFPSGAPVNVLLNQPLPPILGTAIVDASAAGVVLVPSSSFPTAYGMELRGDVTVRGLGFRDFGAKYPPFADLTCPQASYHGSGAIVVTSGSDVAIVESSFSDAAGLGAIRCYAAPIRVYGSPYSAFQTRRARVLRNELLYLPWDGIQVAGVSEHAVVAENRLNGNDLGVGIVSKMNAKASIFGNVVSDGRNQGLYVIAGGALDLVHNVFARMARGGGTGETVLIGVDMPALIANNVYQSKAEGWRSPSR